MKSRESGGENLHTHTHTHTGFPPREYIIVVI